MTEITSLDAVDLSAAIHARTLSCAAVMEAYLDRIEALNPRLNAIVSLRDRPALMAEAEAADAELAVGASRGWLHGMPIALKDLLETTGVPCTFGSPIFADYIPAADDLQARRIKDAGAIVIGKTNVPEWGLGSHTYNTVFGPTRNPHDPARSAGGSSGGAAAALAARLLPVADGSDMMGSLRNPAAFNGVVGFRPSLGRVPSGLAGELFFSQLGAIGPMGRTVRDAARLLETQAGVDPHAPLSLPTENLRIDETRGFAGARVAWLGDFGGYLPFEPGVLELDRAVLDTMSALGCEITETTPPFDMAALWEAWLTLRACLVSHKLIPLHADPAKRALLKPEAVWEVETSRGVTAADIYRASAVRSDWYRCVLGLFERFDYLVLPAAQVFPFPVEQSWPSEIAGRRMDTYHRWMEVVIGPTLAGLPTVAIPAGFGPDGLPNGVQIAGPPRTDRSVLEFAHACERQSRDQTPI